MKKINTNKIWYLFSAIMNLAGVVVAFCISWQAMLVFFGFWILGGILFVAPIWRNYKKERKTIEVMNEKELTEHVNKLFADLSNKFKELGIEFSAELEVKDDNDDPNVTVTDTPFEDCPGEVIPDLDETAIEPAVKKKTRRGNKKKKKQQV